MTDHNRAPAPAPPQPVSPPPRFEIDLDPDPDPDLDPDLDLELDLELDLAPLPTEVDARPEPLLGLDARLRPEVAGDLDPYPNRALDRGFDRDLDLGVAADPAIGGLTAPAPDLAPGPATGPASKAKPDPSPQPAAVTAIALPDLVPPAPAGDPNPAPPGDDPAAAPRATAHHRVVAVAAEPPLPASAPPDQAPDDPDRLADAAAPIPAVEAQVIAYLQQRGRLTGGDLARARKLAEDSAEPLHLMLVKLGLVSDRDMAAAAGAVLDLPAIGADDFPDAPLADLPCSLRFLKDARVLPLALDDDGLEVAIADPLDAFTIQALAVAVERPVRLRVGLATEIEAALARLYDPPKDTALELDADADLGNFSEEDIEHLRDLASEAPVIRLVNQVLQRAVESRASDVHIEPFADELKVRYRIDGILKASESPPVRSTAAVISRIKIMAKLNIAERRLPQDGRIPLRIQGKELDLRVSTVPTMFGESVVMRLLDKESVSFDFDALGFDGPPRERVLRVLELPFGIFLVTGPTGSGKSTTLYTALSRLNTPDRKIITVEDPVEYQVAGINQIPVKASIGMTFAGALRAIVRQDPDIIMVGEMRDLETARIAVQSALTGHVVLSTLHTNDAASGVTRLMDMGVEDYLLTSTINGILAQRLVRRLCPVCREPFEPLSELRAKLDAAGHGVDAPATLYRAVGCPACNGSGYRGRLLIAEVLLMSDRIRQAVLAHATASDIHRIAVAEGMATMYQDGLRKALAGHTTIEEVLRVAVED